MNRIPLLAILVGAFAIAEPAYAQEYLHEILAPTLRGVDAIDVLVQLNGSQTAQRQLFDRIGITRDSVKTKTELNLRKAGVVVRSESRTDAGQSKSLAVGQPTLLLMVTAACSEVTLVCAVHLDAHVMQYGILIRQQASPDLHQFGLITWTQSHLVLMGEDRYREEFDSALSQVLDTFANDWLSVNQKR